MDISPETVRKNNSKLTDMVLGEGQYQNTARNMRLEQVSNFMETHGFVSERTVDHLISQTQDNGMAFILESIKKNADVTYMNKRDPKRKIEQTKTVQPNTKQ